MNKSLVHNTKILEKDSVKLMSWGEKALYFSSQKRTWTMFGAVAIAIHEKDYVNALINLFSFNWSF